MRLIDSDNRPPGGTVTLWAIAAALAAFLVYLPSARYGFVSFDDLRYVPGNAAIRRIDLEFIRLIFTTVIASNWHPLTIFSYALDYAVWGAAPSYYHLENIIWHSVNTALVFLLTIRLYALRAPVDSRALFAGLAASLLFGLHPLHVESVTWISERKDVLSGFFFILSLLMYLRFAGAGAVRRSLYYSASLFAFVLAMLAKPMAVTLPLVLLILDFYPLERIRAASVVKLLAEKVPFFIISLLGSLLTLWAQSYGGAIKTVGTFPLAKRLFITVRGPVFYLYKMAFPFDLAPIYLPPADTSLSSPVFIFCLLVVAVVTAACVALARKNRIYLAAWLFFIVTLLPVLGIIQVGDQAAADRYTYLPSLGPFILASAGAALVFGRLSKGAGKTAMIACTAALFVFLAALTVKQESVWKDSLTLWTHEITTQGEVPLAYNSRGLVHQELGDHKSAIEDFNRAISLDPAYAFPYNNRGYSYQQMRDLGSALRDYNRSIELDPSIPNPYNNRGLIFYESGRYEEAVKDFRKAVELDPKLLNSYQNLGLAYMELRDYESARKSFEAGLRISPMEPSLLLNRGFLRMTTGEYFLAAADFEASIKYGPNEPEAYWGAGLAYLRLGEKPKADEFISKASTMGLPEAREFLLRTKGR